jgi:siderophore synthetase component
MASDNGAVTATTVPAEELRRVRPELVPAYESALPGARAAVLARLWGALAREPIAGITARAEGAGQLRVALPGGRWVSGDAAAAQPFAAPPAGFGLTVIGAGADGVDHADPAEALIAMRLPGATDRLARELVNSVVNLALARAAQPAPTGGPPALDTWRLDSRGTHPDPAGAEQAVVDGHPLHPGCRTRLGMSVAEVLAYAPEHRQIVDLEEVAVPEHRWLSTGAGLPPRLPVHPWQRDHVLTAYPWLRPTGRRIAARPLMSLRTLAPVSSPDTHLKTAVDVQMTSAVRTVSPAAVHNGPTVTALLDRLGTPGLEVLAEPAAGAVLVDGAPCRSLAAVVRRAPRARAGEVVLPLAALAAPSPADGRPLAVEALKQGYAGSPVPFLADLAAVLLRPTLALLHAGVALEAHGQNTLVALRGGRPVRLLYRDVGAVRVSPARLRAAGLEPPPLHGDLPTDDPDALRTKVSAAAGVVIAEQVHVLSAHAGADPARLWAAVGDAVRDAYADLPAAARGDRAALLDRPLPVKATTAMRLAADPLADQWAALPHPIGGPR